MRTFETYKDLSEALDAGTFRFLPEYGPARFRCHDCGSYHQLPTDGKGGTTGYGTDHEGNMFCYTCGAIRTRTDMQRSGKGCLYLTGDFVLGPEVTDWTGKLRFTVGRRILRKHNLAGRAYHVWFCGPDGATWHGVTYGDNTQLCHVKRTHG